MRKALCAVALTTLLAGCSYNATVPASSAASEVLPARRIPATAHVQMDDDVKHLSKRVSTGFTCAEHVYQLDVGRAISESLTQTLEGVFDGVTVVGSRADTLPGGYLIRAQLSDFDVRLRVTAFFTVTTSATADIALRVTAYDPAGNLKFQSTVRGEATIEETGGCNTGIETASSATKKAIGRAMEELVHRLVNTGVLMGKHP